ncbi:hypothetical protein VS_II0046 [Vibrio atlanticus]|uniref:Uncharacterized protein n=1 Tax=Vibrio atlanticus (strain LGP32) TaxID=575788 RepID=B7VQ17_VIBA3|nr:hypothetical protein VS_II0046 [Vibrio atlanticus]
MESHFSSVRQLKISIKVDNEAFTILDHYLSNHRNSTCLYFTILFNIDRYP